MPVSVSEKGWVVIPADLEVSVVDYTVSGGRREASRAC